MEAARKEKEELEKEAEELAKETTAATDVETTTTTSEEASETTTPPPLGVRPLPVSLFPLSPCPTLPPSRSLSLHLFRSLSLCMSVCLSV